MIEIKGVSKNYGNNKIFQDLNMNITDGSRLAIVGRNGSGKSVLLKLICGYSKPSAGSIEIDNEILGNQIDFIPNAGVSINAPEFIGYLSGMDNLLKLAKIRGIATKDDITRLSERLDFEEELSKKYKNYSLGMRQKMRLIQALMDKPRYLILDEPFDGLDKESRSKVLSLLLDYVDENRTLIFTSHNAADVELLSSEVLELEE